MVIAADGSRHLADTVTRDLALIEFDRVLGVLPPPSLDTLSRDGSSSLPSLAAETLDADRDGATIVDVRTRSEWNAGHVPGSVNLPLVRIAQHLDALRNAGPILVHCQGGERSVIAASVLRAAGVSNVTDIVGGYAAWLQSTPSRPEQSS